MGRIHVNVAGLLAALVLASCGGGGGGGGVTGSNFPSPTQSPPPASLMNPGAWEIGPIISSKNYSEGMPLHPSAHPEGWAIDLPQPNSSVGHVHYVTARYGSLSGKSRIVMRFRIEAGPDVRIVPTKFPDSPSILTLYFQRSGDDWSGSGKYEAYRWWATPKSISPLKAGTYEVVAGLNENWTAVQTSSAASNPSGFQAAVANANRVGFTLGGGDGYGHGAYATGPARLVVTKFSVE